MAESVFELSDYPVYNPNMMTQHADGSYSVKMRTNASCTLGFYVPLSDLPDGYQMATVSVEGSSAPFTASRQEGFLTEGGFLEYDGVFRNGLVLTQDGVEYLVPAVRCTNLGTIQTIEVEEVRMTVFVGGQAPVLLGSVRIKGAALGETPVAGLRLGENRLL